MKPLGSEDEAEDENIVTVASEITTDKIELEVTTMRPFELKDEAAPCRRKRAVTFTFGSRPGSRSCPSRMVFKGGRCVPRWSLSGSFTNDC